MNEITYKELLSIAILEMEYSVIKNEKSNIKKERIRWYESGVKCSCERPLDISGDFVDGRGYYDGTCPFCNKRREFYFHLKKISARQSAIRNIIRHKVDAFFETAKLNGTTGEQRL